MSEDDLLVNFAPDAFAFASATNYTGGRWKDRLLAKKIARGRPNKLAPVRKVDYTNEEHGDEDSVLANESVQPSAKKQKGIDRTVAVRDKTDSNRSKVVISSLFTHNPSPQTPIVKEREESRATAPSNAPLLDGIDTFLSLGLSTTLATHLLTKINLKAPTAIQKSAITQLLKEDTDAFIQAETGSGKTLAYLLPVVQRVIQLSKPNANSGSDERVHRDSGLFAIILAPTRELGKQIYSVLETLLRCAHWIVPGIVIGGEKKKSEKARLRRGVNILVATPGRLADHLAQTKALDVSRVRWLVLDEGDRLMELGFEEEIQGIIEKLERQSSPSKLLALPSRRTTVLCSATMKMNVQRLGDISLKDAVHIIPDPNLKYTEAESSTKDSEAFCAPNQLQQSYIIVPAKQRLVTLAALLMSTFTSISIQRAKGVFKAIVFLTCADSVDFHFQLFSRGASAINRSQAIGDHTVEHAKPLGDASSHLPTVSNSPTISSELSIYKLHGSLVQPLRTSTLASFHQSSNPSVLFCTDVASRGLDLPNIDLVIEYDPPFSADDHIHRVGRTARAGNAGNAIVFLMPGPEEGYVDVLQRASSEKIVSRRSPEEVLKKAFSSRKQPRPVGKDENVQAHKSWQDQATDFQLEVERNVAASKRLEDMARKAYISHVRAYATHTTGERKWFDLKELHLGHLAKAFGLRERPGRFGRDGAQSKVEKRHSRHTAVDGGNEKRKKGAMADREDVNGGGELSIEDSKRKMRKAMKEQMDAANEFNIG